MKLGPTCWTRRDRAGLLGYYLGTEKKRAGVKLALIWHLDANYSLHTSPVAPLSSSMTCRTSSEAEESAATITSKMLRARSISPPFHKHDPALIRLRSAPWESPA